MSDAIDVSKIAARIAQRLRAIVVKETVPIVTGELRKSIHVSKYGDGYLVGTNKIYARAVHEGRKALIIRPKKKRALAWNGGKSFAKKVFQPARKGKPFFRDAVDIFESNLDKEIQVLGIDEGAAEWLRKELRSKGLKVEMRG